MWQINHAIVSDPSRIIAIGLMRHRRHGSSKVADLRADRWKVSPFQAVEQPSDLWNFGRLMEAQARRFPFQHGSRTVFQRANVRRYPTAAKRTVLSGVERDDVRPGEHDLNGSSPSLPSASGPVQNIGIDQCVWYTAL